MIGGRGRPSTSPTGQSTATALGQSGSIAASNPPAPKPSGRPTAADPFLSHADGSSPPGQNPAAIGGFGSTAAVGSRRTEPKVGPAASSGAATTPSVKETHGFSSVPAFGSTPPAAMPEFGSSAFGVPSACSFSPWKSTAIGATTTAGSGAFTAPAFGATVTPFSIPASRSGPSSEPAFGTSAFGEVIFGQAAPALGTPAPVTSSGAATIDAFGVSTTSAATGTSHATSMPVDGAATTPSGSSQTSRFARIPACGSSASSVPAFGKSGFGVVSTCLSSFGQSVPAFGASTSGMSFGATTTTACGISNAPTSGAESTATTSCAMSKWPFVATSAPSSGSSDTFRFSSIPAFGSTSSSMSASGKSDFGVASSCSFSFGRSVPAFGTLTSRTSFGATTTAFGISTAPTFGVESTPTTSSAASKWPFVATSAPSSGSSDIFRFSSNPAFGSTSSSMPAFSTSACGTASTCSFSFHQSVPAFGTLTSGTSFGATTTAAFGISTAPTFGVESTPTTSSAMSKWPFVATSAPSSRSSDTFRFSSNPAFGRTSSSMPAFSKSACGAASTFGCSFSFGKSTCLFGTSTSGASFGATATSAFGVSTDGEITPTTSGVTSTLLFGATTTPSSGSSETFRFSSIPAFSSTSSSVHASGTSAFGATSKHSFTFGQSTPTFGTSSSGTAFGATTTTAFGVSTSPTFGAESMSTASSTMSKLEFDATTASSSGSSDAFRFSSIPAFGSTSSSMPAFGTSASGATGTLFTFGKSTRVFETSTSGTCFGAAAASAFGVSTAPTFGSESTPTTFGATTTSSSESSGTFRFSSMPAFGSTPSSMPTFGTSAFGATSTPAFGTRTSGTSFEAASTTAFGVSTAPTFCAITTPTSGVTSTLLFGATTTHSGSSETFRFSSIPDISSTPSNTPVSGASTDSAFGSASSFGQATSAVSTPAFEPSLFAFGRTTFGQNAFDVHGTQPGGYLKSTCAMHMYRGKCHEDGDNCQKKDQGSTSFSASIQTDLLNQASAYDRANAFRSNSGLFFGQKLPAGAPSSHSSTPAFSSPFGSSASVTSSPSFSFGVPSSSASSTPFSGSSSMASSGAVQPFGSSTASATAPTCNTNFSFRNTQSDALFQSSPAMDQGSRFELSRSLFGLTSPRSSAFGVQSTGSGGNLFAFARTTSLFSGSFQSATPASSFGLFSFGTFGHSGPALGAFGSNTNAFNQNSVQPASQTSVVFGSAPSDNPSGTHVYPDGHVRHKRALRQVLPEKYNYWRIETDPSLYTDCVICMTTIDFSQSSKDCMVTPCSHFFHTGCLRRWMDIKMECPTCRSSLPPA